MEASSHLSLADQDRHVLELERTVASLREGSEVAQILLGLSAALSSVRSVDETLDLAARMAPPALGADRCVAIRVLDHGRPVQSQEDLHVAGGAGARDGAPTVESMPFVKQALEAGAPVMLTGADAARCSSVTAPRAQSVIFIPLARWTEDLGALQVEFLEPQDFTPRQREVAAGIGAELATALTNARQYSLFEGLKKFGLRVGRRLQVAPLTEQISAGIVELLDADAATVYLSARSQSVLVHGGGDHWPLGGRGSLLQIDLDRPPWDALTRGESVSIDDLGHIVEGADRLGVVAAPIPRAGKGILGALVAWFSDAPKLSPDDSEALGVAAAQAGIAIKNARRYERQRRMARHLQDGLLKTKIPVMERCEIGTVYQPASGTANVGGDFFDVFELPNGRFGFVVGDVSGKGAEAAAQTAMAKYMLRAYVTSDPAPASALSHLNNGLLGSMGEERFTTLVYGLFDPETRRCCLGSAGHPGPLLYRQSTRGVEHVELSGGLLGAFENQRYEESCVDLLPGDVLLAYTDGLLEVRSGDELYGRERLTKSLSELSFDASASDIARAVFEEANSFGKINDDTVVFALKCSPEG